jgi:5-methylcytosine-specific restriction protein A
MAPVAKVNRNPSWARDELILALDLYFRHRPLKINHNHPEVVGLSDFLKRLRVHSNPPDQKSFRNPNSVYMKLCNFLPLDPLYKGKGLSRGGAQDRAVWNEFSGNADILAETAAAIRASAGDGGLRTLGAGDEDEEEFPEGRLLFRAHIARERNSRLVQQAKKRALERDGKLLCQACGFDYGETYGPLGENYIECHHVVPVSQLTPHSKTRIRDIVLLCSNCHRMIHRRRPWLGIRELRALLTGAGA